MALEGARVPAATAGSDGPAGVDVVMTLGNDCLKRSNSSSGGFWDDLGKRETASGNCQPNQQNNKKSREQKARPFQTENSLSGQQQSRQ